jgi:2-methylcitrate dehydratase PrpD
MPRDDDTATLREGISGRLARYALSTDWTDIPDEVRRRAQHHILDATGIALASTAFDFADRTLAGLQSIAGEGGSVGVIGKTTRLPPRDAAIMNGVLCHGLDFDDTHLGGVVHPTASAFPTALAAGVMAGADGKAMMTAYIVGVEAAARLGAVAKGGFHRVGFHPTGVVGAFSSALVAGKLLGLDEKQLAAAQGIALSMASGSLEFLEDGAWTKRLHPGWAAAAGITAACLARAGFVGATAPYEGRFGLYNAYMGDERASADPALAVAGLGERWELMQTAIKPFPACHFTHGCIDAAIALSGQAEVARIKRVRALVPAEVVPVVCEPIANKRRPANSYDAQFSIPYLVAVGFSRGRMGLEDLEDASLANPDLLHLADRVSYEVDAAAGFPKHYSGEVIIELDDGATLRHREQINRGAAERPISNTKIVAKYRANARYGADQETVDRIEKLLLQDLPAGAAELSDGLAG